MALINCDECKNKMSERAKYCPHCGAPHLKNGITLLGLFFAILMFIVMGMVLIPALL